MTTLFILALIACIVLGFLYYQKCDEFDSTSYRLNHEIDELRCLIHSAQDEARSAQDEERRARDELENRESNFRRCFQGLRDRLKHCLLQKNDSPGNIVDREFKNWLEKWEENGGDAPNDSFSDTADELFSALNRLDSECDEYTVRFKAEQGRRWCQPSEWLIDDDGDLVLKDSDDEDAPFTVSVLKEILTGDRMYEGQRVQSNTEIFVDLPDKDGDSLWFRPLDDRFSVNRDKELIVIKMNKP